MYDKTLNKWRMPQEFKGIKFYPLKLIDEKYYNIVIKALAYPKNSIIDKDISKSSYLGFMITVLHESYREHDAKMNLIEDFEKLIGFITNLSCHIECSNRVSSPKKIIDRRYAVVIGNTRISETEFDELRKIIVEQNGISLQTVNEYHPDLEKRLIQSQKKDEADFEEKLFAFVDVCGLTIDQVMNYSYYQFNKHFARSMIRFEYELFKPLEQSGQIKLKKGEIRHWLSHLSKKGRYDSILINKDNYTNNSDIFKVTK